MKKILCLLVLSIAAVLVFSSCKEDEETSVWYTLGISDKINPVQSEMKAIQDAYFFRLGVQTSPFNLEGTRKACDAQVKKAAKEAEADLADQTWEGYYVFSISTFNPEKKIYSKPYGTYPVE